MDLSRVYPPDRFLLTPDGLHQINNSCPPATRWGGDPFEVVRVDGVQIRIWRYARSMMPWLQPANVHHHHLWALAMGLGLHPAALPRLQRLAVMYEARGPVRSEVSGTAWVHQLNALIVRSEPARSGFVRTRWHPYRDPNYRGVVRAAERASRAAEGVLIFQPPAEGDDTGRRWEGRWWCYGKHSGWQEVPPPGGFWRGFETREAADAALMRERDGEPGIDGRIVWVRGGGNMFVQIRLHLKAILRDVQLACPIYDGPVTGMTGEGGRGEGFGRRVEVA